MALYFILAFQNGQYGKHAAYLDTRCTDGLNATMFREPPIFLAMETELTMAPNPMLSIPMISAKLKIDRVMPLLEYLGNFLLKLSAGLIVEIAPQTNNGRFGGLHRLKMKSFLIALNIVHLLLLDRRKIALSPEKPHSGRSPRRKNFDMSALLKYPYIPARKRLKKGGE